MSTRNNKSFAISIISLLLLSVTSIQAQQPADIQLSELTVQATHIGAMPAVLGPTVVQGQLGTNIGSPVAIGNDLYLIDQHDAIYRLSGDDNGPALNKVFSVADGPDGLILENRQAILNISPGRDEDSIFVMFTATKASALPHAPLYEMPEPLSEPCCPDNRIIPDIYNVLPDDVADSDVDFIVFPGLEYQVLYEYELDDRGLEEPRPIAAFETQGGPTHNGGGMLTLPDGRVLFATGDGLPFGTSGRSSAQDPTSHLSKLLIIDPDDGSIEVAASGVRNVQHLEFIEGNKSSQNAVIFADIGGVTAEEINVVELPKLLNLNNIENFGWGTNPDGFQREGTFYVDLGQALTFGTPPVLANAPSPEPGFMQPHAQYGRNDTNGLGGVAASGPVTSQKSFHKITALFSDLSSGILYATTAPVKRINSPVFKVNLVDEHGAPRDTLKDLVGLPRVDPRFFRFPDGTAGVMLEATGDFYRLTELDAN